MGAAFAQAHSSQDYVNSGGTWQWTTATKGTKTGSSVTSSSQDGVNYWVVWRDGQYAFRVRKDDPSLDAGESELLATAEREGKGVDVEVGDDNGPVISGVTIRP